MLLDLLHHLEIFRFSVLLIEDTILRIDHANTAKAVNAVAAVPSFHTLDTILLPADSKFRNRQFPAVPVHSW